MKRLYLLRHAKSSWSDPSLADHERPLAPRGRKAAKKIAEHLRRQGITLELVLCSPARRTRETLERIAPALGERVSVTVEPELYAAGAEELLARLRRLPEEVSSVMLIGHNPGLHVLALGLARGGASLERLADRFPTAALATLEIAEARWGELGEGGAELAGYVVPRDL